MNKKTLLVIVGIAVLGGVVFVLLGGRKTPRPTAGEEPSALSPPSSPESVAVEDAGGLGAEVFKKTSNPLSNELPETNPFRVDTNPFK